MALNTEPTVTASAIAGVRDRIARAASGAGRDPAEVTLIAVSKGFGLLAIAAAADAGNFDFGENRVHELVEKQRELSGNLRWHFIGRLQRNKVGKLLPAVACIHSLDRIELAREINSRSPHPVGVLIEVNVSGEKAKAGVSPAGLPALIKATLKMPRLDLIGLMTMTPRAQDPEASRAVFRELARLRAQASHTFSSPGIHHLSMGMSQDYEVAVEEGSTMVRVGEAIFGERIPAARKVDHEKGRDR